MTMKILRPALLALILLAVPVAADATADDLRSVAGMQSHNSALIVFAPSLSDQRMRQQHAIMARLAVQAARHDLLFVQVDPQHVIGSHDTASALRRRFRVQDGAFRVALMGKNGRMLLSGGAPLAGAAIIRALDAAH
jgi:hypothetical protein